MESFSMSSTKRVIVTGGSGFIGSHVVDRLIGDGHHVTVIDNLATGRLANLDAHRSEPRLRFVQADICDYQAISPKFAGAKWVFHLAALADIVPSTQRPLDYHAANVDGTIKVLEASRLAGVEKLVYAASSSCYGIPDVYPTPETAPLRPMYPYALTKLLGEQYVLHWNQTFRLPANSLRLFNVYGPRSRTSGTYGAVFGVFLSQKLANQPFTVVGDGTQTRDFTFVADVAEAFVMAATSPLSGRIFNIGTGRPQSVNRLVELLEGEVIHIPKRPGEPDQTCADARLANNELGWQPRVGFEEGVGRVLAVIDQWRGAPVWNPATIQAATRDWFAFLGESTIPSISD
jgi:UDP-glucose 4-epimerase